MKSHELEKKLSSVNLSQAELARRLGKDVTTVNRWIKGRAPVPQYAVAYLEVLSRLRLTVQPAYATQ